jgi:hypothetical protein
MGLASCDPVTNPEPERISRPSIQSARPVQDEWGIYDPEQAGLEAVMRRLTATRDDSSDATDPSPSDSAPHR